MTLEKILENLPLETEEMDACRVIYTIHLGYYSGLGFKNYPQQASVKEAFEIIQTIFENSSHCFKNSQELYEFLKSDIGREQSQHDTLLHLCSDTTFRECIMRTYEKLIMPFLDLQSDFEKEMVNLKQRRGTYANDRAKPFSELGHLSADVEYDLITGTQQIDTTVFEIYLIGLAGEQFGELMANYEAFRGLPQKDKAQFLAMETKLTAAQIRKLDEVENENSGQFQKKYEQLSQVASDGRAVNPSEIGYFLATVYLQRLANGKKDVYSNGYPNFQNRC